MKYGLSVISFTNHTLGIVSKKVSLCQSSSSLLLLSSRSFTVLCFTFRLKIDFELIFLKRVKSVSRFICLHANIQPHSSLSRVWLQCRRSGFNSWVGKIPWRRKRHPTPVFLPGKPHGPRSLVACSPWGGKESDTYITIIHNHTFMDIDNYTDELYISIQNLRAFILKRNEKKHCE